MLTLIFGSNSITDNLLSSESSIALRSEIFDMNLNVSLLRFANTNVMQQATTLS